MIYQIDLPKVLIIGDSISIEYTPYLKDMLKDKINLCRVPTNCGSTTLGLKNINKWVGEDEWDFIIFNFGLHDLGKPNKYKKSINKYSKNLEKIVKILKNKGKTIIFVTTTPITNFMQKSFGASPAELNDLAINIIKKCDIIIFDLFKQIYPYLEEYQLFEDIHFSQKGYKFIAQYISSCLLECLVDKV